MLVLFTIRDLSDSSRPVSLQPSLGMLMQSVFLILLVLLLHLVAGEGAAMYIKDSKHISPPLYITPSLLLQLVRGDVEARNPMDRKQLLSPPQAMDQLFFPPQKRDQLFPHPKDRHHLLSPPKYRDQILSPPKDRHHLLSPPTLRGKRAGLWVPRWVKKVREDITQKQGEIIK